MTTAIEKTPLMDREETSNELQTAYSGAAAQHEIQSAIVIAKRFPRDEDGSYARIIKACKRISFAGDCTYSFPRGGTNVSGPSIYLAREFARVWGNIRHGCDIVHDDDNSRTIRAWAWDLETNVRVHADDTFQKSIFRKRVNATDEVVRTVAGGAWIRPDERDLRELTNRRAALAKRNCLLELLPSDMVEDAIREAGATIEKGVKEDPDGARKAIVKGFTGIGVSPEQIAQYLGHPIAQSSPAEIAELRKTWKAISDGQTTWAAVTAEKSGKADPDKNSQPPSDKSKVQQMEEELKTKGKKKPDAPKATDADAADREAFDKAQGKEMFGGGDADEGPHGEKR